MAADKQLNCRDCGADFTFTASEQDFYASKGFTNEPSRCPSCRAQRKSSRGESGGYSSGGYSSGGGYGGGYDRPRREMFTATCAQCGNEASVPFRPSNDKPVYCSDCFEQRRGASSGYGGGSRGGGRGGRW